MIRTVNISVILLFLILRSVSAQEEFSVGSVSGVKVNSWYNIDLDSSTLQHLSESVQSKDVSFQFAIPVPVNLTPENSGRIYQLNDEVVWIEGIRSKNAKSLSLILEPFNVPQGAYVYIYDKNRSTIRGAFTEKNNSASCILPTLPVPGDELILEYHIPKGEKWQNTIGITQISHDYLGIFGSFETKDGRYNLSQACNVDINCTEGLQYSTEKGSVCRLIINGTELCSGILLNNTNQQNRAFFLTAEHCIGSQSDADKTIFVFGYESPWCKGPDGKISHSISGSTLRSSNVGLDFTLVEMNTFPPLIYKPYLAGWDISGTTPAHSAAIHHPMGDVKKISIDLDPPESATFNSMTVNSSWKIAQWDSGTTEGGSSGSPLFDQNKRVVGVLLGGEAVCGRSINDYFGKLSVYYNYSSILDQQIKGWIDPAVSGAKQLNGRDPYAANLTGSDTLWNLSKNETPAFVKYTSPGQGYDSGFNSDSLNLYAEYFKNSTSREITEVWINICKANAVSSTDSVRVFVYNDGTVPGTILASQKILVAAAKDTFRVKLDFNKTVPVSGNFYIGWQIWYGSKAVNELRQFAAFHSPDRGLTSKNTAWFKYGSTWKPFYQHPFAAQSVSLDVKVISVANSTYNKVTETRSIQEEFRVYPNPADDKIIVATTKDYRNLTVRIMDITGKILQTNVIYWVLPGEITTDISHLKAGLYLLNISSENYSETHKMLINR